MPLLAVRFFRSGFIFRVNTAPNVDVNAWRSAESPFMVVIFNMYIILDQPIHRFIPGRSFGIRGRRRGFGELAILAGEREENRRGHADAFAKFSSTRRGM